MTRASTAPASTPAAPQTVRVAPTGGWTGVRLRELWDYRELVYFLAWRDVKVRYKQTVLGAAWAVIQPFLSMVVFSVFFGRLAKMPSDGVPYPVFSYAALVPWMFFANGLQQSSNSLVGSANLIKKVYFPRLIVPISSVLSGLVDFVVALSVLFVLMAYWRVPATANVIWLPAFVLLALLTSLGVGLWLSAANVQFRDVRYTVPFVTQFWLFLTPVVYPSSLVPGAWRVIYGLNPLAGVIDGFRWALLGSGSLSLPMMTMSTASALLLFVSGVLYFRRMERTFADVV
jgi:lipopolysaccharide transport system permease protein